MSSSRRSPKLPVAVLVLNWNGKALSEACLASWAKADPAPQRVLLVDNGSTDGSLAWLKRRFPKVEFLALKENFGFAAGNNRGFEALLRRGLRPKAIFICNNDTTVHPDMLGHLWQGLRQHAQWGIVSPRITTMRSGKLWFEGGFIGAWNVNPDHHGMGRRPWPAGPAFQLGPREFATGCGMLVRSDLGRRLGWFDERLWAYAEDSDLCFRARELGTQTAVVPQAQMQHAVSASFGLGSAKSVYFITRNSLWLARRHGLGWPLGTWRGGVIAYLASALLRRLILAALRGKGDVVRALLAGALDALKGNPDPSPSAWPIKTKGRGKA